MHRVVASTQEKRKEDESVTSAKDRSWNIDSLVLIFSVILLAQVLVYVIPQGEFDRQPYPENPDRSMVIAGSYNESSAQQMVDIQPWYFLKAIPMVFAAAQDIIFLI
jgi:uncharacterized ion transporter superfamily protein YfcC